MRSAVEELYDACSPEKTGNMNRTILSVYYGLGLRRMEGVGLDFSDIQWNSGIVYVRHAKHKQERYVPMNQRVQKDLELNNIRYRVPLLKKPGGYTNLYSFNSYKQSK